MAHKTFTTLMLVSVVLLSADSVLSRPIRAEGRSLKALNDAGNSYIGSTCPDKSGYMTMSNMNWVTAKDSQANSEDNAERNCNMDPNCVGFNSLGYYALSSFTGLYPHPGLCTYVKKGTTVSSGNCIEYDGYTTLSNTNWMGTKDSQMRNAGDAKSACEGDDNCTLFNSYAYYTLATPSALAYTPYGGLCSYIKDNQV